MPEQPSDTLIAALLTDLLRTTPYLLYFLLLMITVAACFAAYLILRDRFSKGAKDIADAQKSMAEAVRNNTEAMASAPQIIQSLSTLVSERLSAEAERLSAMMSQQIDEKITGYTAKLAAAVDTSKTHLNQIESVRMEITNLAKSIESQRNTLREEYARIQSVLPDYALWKDVADPEQLVYKLQLCDSWDAGKDIVGQLQRLVGDSAERPERIPAKFIEAAGDWCRSKNQYPLALWFYDSALDRDPEIFTCKVEYYCLLAEFVPSKRANAIDSLRELALVARNQATLARIFNAFLELQRYAKLVQVIDSVIAVDNFREQANIYAMLLRNRAVARRSINRGMITSDALEDIRMAMQLSSGDEDIQWTYAQFLFDDRRYEEAAHIYTKLIGMDPRDIRYYRYLALSYASIGRREAALKVIEVAKEFVSEDRDIVALTNALRQVQALTGSDEIEGVRIVQELLASQFLAAPDRASAR